jgi:hypothetical protein
VSILSASLLVLASVSLLIGLVVVTQLELQRGRRMFMRGFREWLDNKLDAVYQDVTKRFRLILRHTIKLSWYYSIHSTLRAILTVLVKLYDRIELIFIENRDKTKRLRAEKRALRSPNHLTMIGEHKASTALTPHQKKKLRAKKLAGE